MAGARVLLKKYLADELSASALERAEMAFNQTTGRAHLMGGVTLGGQAMALLSDIGASSFVTGMIIMWHGLLVNIPSGWVLCDGTAGTPDLRDRFVKGAAAGVDPGATGGAATHTPAGTVAAPVFTGSALGAHSHGSGTLVPSAHAGTAVADHAAQTTGAPSATSGQLVGVINVASDVHTHSTPALIHSVTQPSAHTMSGATSSDSAGTPAGTNSAPVFTGTNANDEPAYYAVAFIMKT